MANFIIVKVNDSKWAKCACCEEQLRPLEPRFSVRNEKNRSQGTYCKFCVEDQIPQRNAALNGDSIVESFDDAALTAERQYEKKMETFAAYKAAGCVSDYWTDTDSGKAH